MTQRTGGAGQGQRLCNSPAYYSTTYHQYFSLFALLSFYVNQERRRRETGDGEWIDINR